MGPTVLVIVRVCISTCLRCSGTGLDVAQVLWWGVRAPLWATVPDCRSRPALWPFTFAMCVAWIGAVSYLVAWIITILGEGRPYVTTDKVERNLITI